jgi:hypothetical protein
MSPSPFFMLVKKNVPAPFSQAGGGGVGSLSALGSAAQTQWNGSSAQSPLHLSGGLKK